MFQPIANSEFFGELNIRGKLLNPLEWNSQEFENLSDKKKKISNHIHGRVTIDWQSEILDDAAAAQLKKKKCVQSNVDIQIAAAATMAHARLPMYPCIKGGN